MAISILSSAQVLDARKSNAFADWPSRDEINRVEPLATPALNAGFRFRPRERIFTIGSCFARNVEQVLEERGYDVPVRQLLRQPEFAGLNPAFLNNYGVTSIRQELTWAFDARHPFDPTTNFLEYAPGAFVDLHLPAQIRPDRFEVVERRRRGIIECTRLISTCRVVVITPGLSEVWWDRLGRCYVNTSPRLSTLHREPDRFELHVLDFNETHDNLAAAMTLIHENAEPGVQVLLTVSPVPMNPTHRAMDVMVANTYSKSLLRVAAEHVAASMDFVHYFPSYESVVMSDRSRAWRDDQIHVSPELVTLNVTRMLRAYGETETLDAPAVLAELQRLREKGVRPQWFFVQEHRDVVRGNPQLAVQFARLAISQRDPDSALWAIEALEALKPPFTREFLSAETLFAAERYQDALQALDIVAAQPRHEKLQPAINRDLYRLRTSVYLALRNIEAATAAAMDWSRNAGSRLQELTPLLVLARGLRDLGRGAEALGYMEQIAPFFAEEPAAMVDYAEMLARGGQYAKALEVVGHLKVDLPVLLRRIEAIRAFATPLAPEPQGGGGATGA
ncbi:MAG: GSCFA domain-containing protein [Rhizobiales bacterium]|nr:GSCFA domain-containing protein [Hyphomicrobiales bacterium]